MQSIQFGTGALYAQPIGGNMAANPTPRRFASLQDVQLDIAVTLKELRGMFLFPDDVAPAQMKITGKAKMGQIDGNLFNDLFFGQTIATTPNPTVTNEAHSVPATTPFTVTITPPASGTFADDLGVLYSATGQAFTKVASAPAVGQYSISGGVYTFASADASAGVLVSYTYTLATGGTLITVNNQLQGFGPVFECWVAQQYSGHSVTWKLFSCRSNKLTAPTKIGDYTIPEFDFEAYANAAGVVLSIGQI